MVFVLSYYSNIEFALYCISCFQIIEWVSQRFKMSGVMHN